MIRQHKNFSLLLDPPGKPDHQSIHCPTANFGPLSRSSISNPILITVSDTYLTQRSPGAWVRANSDSECSGLAHFSMSLVHKYLNPKDPYNQFIKEQVTTKQFLKKNTGFTWNPQPQSQCAEGVFQIQFIICDANFSNNISITQVRVNDRKTSLSRPLKRLKHYFSPLYYLIINPYVKHPPAHPHKFVQKSIFLHAKLLYEKGDTMLYLHISPHF